MNTIEELSFNLGALLEQKDHILVTAESCTGGGVATAITDIAGSSAWLIEHLLLTATTQKSICLASQLKPLDRMER